MSAVHDKAHYAICVQLGIQASAWGKWSGATELIADMSLPESLPVGWTSRYDEASKQIVYTDSRTGDQRNTHPLLDYYLGVLFMEAQGNEMMRAIEKETPPGDKEVADMCEYLRIGSGEDPYIKEIARMALSAPLPPNWEEEEDETGNLMYRNTATGATQPSHPLDMYFSELIARRRAEVDLGKTAITKDPAPSPPAVLAAAYAAEGSAAGPPPETPLSGGNAESDYYSDDLEGDAEGSGSAATQSRSQNKSGMPDVDAGAMQQRQRQRLSQGLSSQKSGVDSNGWASPLGFGGQDGESVDGGKGQESAVPTREHIRVAVRARPLLNLQKDVSAWVINSKNNTLQLRDQMVLSNKAALVQNRLFRFNSVEGPDTTNEALTAQHVQPLLHAALKGINSTVCAYGQTGSGKTHTMFGPSDVRSGVVGLSLAYLFGKMEEAAALSSKPHSGKDGQQPEPTQYKITLSMLELYNEQLQDLLASQTQQQNQTLQLMDDPQQGIRVHGLTEVECPSYARALSVLESGCAARSIGATQLNERSSRAHTIVRVQLEGWGDPALGNQQGEKELRSMALLHFVDLAGSERLARTGTSGIRFTEGTSINLSLLMLGSVVAKLADGKRSDQFIPYRNSKLTRLLQPCLGGNARTAILATINPSQQHVEETLNTLQFAQRTMNVVNTVVQNRVGSLPAKGGREQEAAIATLRNQVAQLQAQLDKAKSTSTSTSGPVLGSLSEEQLQGLEARLGSLESSKGILLDRLEALTGQPQGGVWDNKPPPTPPDLHLPAPRPAGRAGVQVSQQHVTAEMALRSISRVAQTGRPTGSSGALRLAALATAKGGSGPDGLEPPEAVVMSVRRMRAERDELRRREAKLRKQLNNARTTLKGLEPYLHQQSAIEDCVSMLDDLIGPAPQLDFNLGGKGKDQTMAQMDIMDRLREGVESVVLLSAELSAVQRQLHSSIALQQAAEQRANELEALWHNSSQRTGSTSAQHPGPEGNSGEVGELRQVLGNMDKYAKSLKHELTATKTELAKWRGFTDEAPVMAFSAQGDLHNPSVEWAPGSRPIDHNIPAHDAQGKEGAEDAGNKGGAVVVGSMAIRAAREARARAAALQQELQQVQEQRAQLQAKVAELETRVAAAVAAAAVPPARPPLAPVKPQTSPVKAGKAGGSKGPSSTGDGLEGAGALKKGEAQGKDAVAEETPAEQQDKFERAKARVVSLAREVAALTRERDSLLGIVLEAANQARAQGTNSSSGDGVPLFMPTSLAQRLLAGGNLPGSGVRALSSNLASALSQSSMSSSIGQAAAMYKPHPPQGQRKGRAGIQKQAAAYNLKQIMAMAGADSGQAPRPSFDASPPPLEARLKMQKVEDRAVQRGELPPIPGDPNSKDMAGNPGAGGADLVALKRQLVLTEKARRQGEVRAAAQVKAAEQEVAAVKKQAAAASSAAAEKLAQAEEAHAAELGQIKSEATGAITTLMQENARLRRMVSVDQVLNSKLAQSAAGGSLF